MSSGPESRVVVVTGVSTGIGLGIARVLAAHSPDGTVPTFDVHLLGMGGEGHINSLFPDTAAVQAEVERLNAEEAPPPFPDDHVH